jgi:hypothetical protein
MKDTHDGTWRNPYFDFALTVPQAHVLRKILTHTPIDTDETEIATRLISRLDKFLVPRPGDPKGD